ncbi:mechanosensitive ion channel family protein [Aliiruegeria lutimaris]|uniref:Mechanosensitive ion channel n=1 Tax=Aliiruegeria lutimaris TaxID=571298 RepID=A0A1G8P8R5_9RHOB|nr:mechanosensitive ion channel domain-containing protein [Aliiruegeria lutimaris]SDI88726.1 Mechanosensitive ion channel [Aliiruegeria lutimaris]
MSKFFAMRIPLQPLAPYRKSLGIASARFRGQSCGMEQDIRAFLEELLTFAQQLETSGRLLLLPSRLLQLGIIAVLILLSQLVRILLADRIRDRIRQLEGRSKTQLRMFVMLQRRVALITFCLLCWLTVFVMRDVMELFPSRSYMIVVAGTIAFAWLVIGITTRFIANPFMRRIVNWGAWIFATLHFTGMLDEFAQLLDSLSIEIQDFRLSLLNVLQAIVITGALLFVARVLSRAGARSLRGNEDISPSMGELLSKLLQAFLYVSAVFLGLRAVGFDPSGFTVLSGAIGVGIGFGLQKIVSNIVSGAIILMDQSVKPGDVISLGDTFGWIQSLGARYVSVVTRDGREYLIPNEDLITSQVVNWSHSDEFVRLDIHFGTDYEDDPYLVRRTAIAAAKSVPRVLSSKSPVCHITGFGDSSVDYVLRFWITDPTKGLTNVRGDVFLALWDAFKENGINIPFPRRDLRMLPDEIPAQKVD